VPKKEDKPGAANFRELVDFRLAQLALKGSPDIRSNHAYLRNGRFAAAKRFGADTRVGDIKPEDVVTWLRKVASAGVKTGQPRAYLSATFTAAGQVDFDPTSDFRAPGKPGRPRGRHEVPARDRALSLGELRAP
jgi:hypothetical protein